MSLTKIIKSIGRKVKRTEIGRQDAREQYANLVARLDDALQLYRSERAEKAARQYLVTFNKDYTSQVVPLQRTLGSTDITNTYRTKGFTGLVEIAEDLGKESKVAQKLASSVYDHVYKWFSQCASSHLILPQEATPKMPALQTRDAVYVDFPMNRYGLAIIHGNEWEYLDVLYAGFRAAKLLGKLDELRDVVLKIPAFRKFIETDEGGTLRGYLGMVRCIRP